MKLFVWTPDSHGQLSFFVMAENEQQARAAVDAHVEMVRHDRSDYIGRNPVDGWGTDYYTLDVYDIGEVVEHEND